MIQIDIRDIEEKNKQKKNKLDALSGKTANIENILEYRSLSHNQKSRGFKVGVTFCLNTVVNQNHILKELNMLMNRIS